MHSSTDNGWCLSERSWAIYDEGSLLMIFISAAVLSIGGFPCQESCDNFIYLFGIEFLFCFDSDEWRRLFGEKRASVISWFVDATFGKYVNAYVRQTVEIV